MKLGLSEERTLLVETLERALQREKARIRAAEEIGFDAAQWRVFCELGLPLLRVPAAHGGADQGLLDAVLVAETLAKNLALVPAIDVMTTSRLLAELGASVATDEVHVLALHDAAELREQSIAFAAIAHGVVYRSGRDVLLLRRGHARAPNLGGSAMASVRLVREESEVLASGDAALGAFEAAVEEWKLLNAAAIVAMGRRALEVAAEYARERHAFGRPIGSYQGLAHPLADSLAEIDGAALLVRRTVEAIGAKLPKAAAMIAMSAWWAARAATAATTKAMRVFGGYGMTMEYDAQIYWRRVTAQSLLAGDPERELTRVADRLWGGAAVALPAAGEVGISFELPASSEWATEATRRIFAQRASPERKRWSFETGDGHDPELYRALAKEGVLFPDWPKAHGGGGDAFDAAAVRGVMVENDWMFIPIAVTDMLGKMIIHFGSERAKREILPRLASGESVATLCYSEPSCGSDIFAATTRAVRDGDEWAITGQKMFTSHGHIADYGLMLARTSDGDKHASLTLFVLPLKQPGYACDGMATIGEETTNTTFYDHVRVTDAYRLGEVDGGAKVLAAALTMEQGSADSFVGALDVLLVSAVAWARGATRDGKPAIDDPAVRARLASVATHLEVTDALSRRTIWAFGTGNAKKHYGPMAKLFGSEAWVTCSAALMTLAAPDTLLQGYSTLGRIEKLYRRSVPSTIYAGTSEVQRSMLAEAGLGLPRSRS